MISATTLQFETRRRINRFNTDYEKKLTVPVLDSIINEALELAFQQSALLFEVRDDIALNLDPLVKRDVSLSLTTDNKKVKASFKEDHYKILRLVAKATSDKCKEPKDLIVRLFQTQKVSEGLKSPYWKPSFEWEETIGVINNHEHLDVYHNNEFTINDVYIDYIMKHPKIATPSLTEKKSYINSAGETVFADQGLILDNALQMRQICDIAALIAARDLGDQLDFQTEVSKIQFSNTHYLGIINQ